MYANDASNIGFTAKAASHSALVRKEHAISSVDAKIFAEKFFFAKNVLNVNHGVNPCGACTKY